MNSLFKLAEHAYKGMESIPALPQNNTFVAHVPDQVKSCTSCTKLNDLRLDTCIITPPMHNSNIVIKCLKVQESPITEEFILYSFTNRFVCTKN